MDNLGYSAKGKDDRPPFFFNSETDATAFSQTSILDGYEFGEKIGEGGMATVYRGQQLSLHRPVAIKMLNQQMAKHSQVYEAFEREAVIIARLNHPNIIHVIDRGIIPAEDGDKGSPFFIMEFVDGIDLSQLIQTGHLPLQKKIEICLQICKALSYAHKNGVIHRDVKPGNIIVDDDFNVKVLDFGIALFYRAESRTEQADITEVASSVMGTFNYMAPELEASAAAATAVSDIYSLGVIMYELFAGQFPNHLQRLKSPGDTPLPNSVAALVMRCLSPEPQKRPRSMADICDQLLLLLRGAHLDKQRVKRANDSINNRKTFSLLDIIRDQPDSAVYLFIEKNSGQQLVVKKITGTYKGFETALRLAKLSHPNSIRVHGASKNKRAFIVVMDYQRGGNLRDRLVKPFGADTFLPIARQICRGLACAHRQQIIHGNLHPGNILFDDNEVVKISDFGLIPHSESNQTAKIQLPADAFKVKDEPQCPQSDLYACGVIFHLLLLGALPRYQNNELQAGRNFKRLPEELQFVLRGLLQRNLLKRFKSVQEVQQAFEKLSDAMPTQVWSSNAAPKISSLGAYKKKMLLLLLIVLFICLI